jgi:molybdopterin converting factor small subunit
MKRVNSAAAALRELTGQSQKRKDAEEELEDALDALEEAAKKQTAANEFDVMGYRVEYFMEVHSVFG